MIVKEQQSVVHLPDLLFVKYCKENFGLNKGVYNVIDEWFYNKNLKNVEIRRQKVLEFLLCFIDAMNKESNMQRVRFGKGELINYLTEYWKQ